MMGLTLGWFLMFVVAYVVVEVVYLFYKNKVK